MKFLLKNLIIFLTILLILKYIVFLLNPGHITKYNIGNFEIKEQLKTKNNSNYYFEIEGEKQKINFQIYKDYGKKEKVIKKLPYQKIDDYDCFLPIFKDKEILTDIMCVKDDVIMNASNLNNQIIIDTFKKYGYNPNKYKDSDKEITISNTEILYKENIPKNNYVAEESYRGLTLFSSKDSMVNLFENDIYTKPISIFTNKYYLVADYNSEYTFRHFYLVNIINGEKKTIRSYDEISFDSYIMGEVDGEVYLLDKDARKQYKINIEYENVEEVGNKDGIKYYDGKWKTITLNEALNEKHFEKNQVNIKGFEKSYKINDYYYMYKKEGSNYKIYRADKQNKKLKTYLFETNDINSITYVKDKVYFKNGNTFYYYGNNKINKILKNTELDFNSDISLGVYEK